MTVLTKRQERGEGGHLKDESLLRNRNGSTNSAKIPVLHCIVQFGKSQSDDFVFHIALNLANLTFHYYINR